MKSTFKALIALVLSLVLVAGSAVAVFAEGGLVIEDLEIFSEESSEFVDEEIPEDPGVQYIPGDVDGSGKISAEDARTALRIAAKLIKEPTEQQMLAADVTGDGLVQSKDARRILRVSAKLDKAEDFGKDIPKSAI